jgi:hypothetical protein
METKPYIEIDWEADLPPLYGSIIELPANVILWRGYNRAFPVISSRATYYSSKEVAMGYVANPQTHELGTFMTTRPLRIMDYQFMKNLLSNLIQTHRKDEYIQDFCSVMLSFGLCSLSHQIRLAKGRFIQSIQDTFSIAYKGLENMKKLYNYDYLLEQQGIRVAETTNDRRSMIFLKELFDGHVDGYISPRLHTPFHVEKQETLPPKLILFHPKRTGIIQIRNYPNMRVLNYITKQVKLSNVITKNIVDFIQESHHKYMLDVVKAPDADSRTNPESEEGLAYRNDHPIWVKPTTPSKLKHRITMKWYMKGGKIRRTHKHKQSNNTYRTLTTAGRYWRNKLVIINPNARVPCVPVSPFVQQPINTEELPNHVEYEYINNGRI